MKNKKMTSLLTSGMLASTLVFSVGVGSVFANESTESIEETVQVDLVTETIEDEGQATEGIIDLQDGEATEEEVKEEDAVLGNAEVTAEEEVKAPSLVPGDFFYFVKTMTEKIRLAFTFNDYKEAELLAEFTAERIAEANALIAEGQTEEAEALLQKAIETQEQANESLPEVAEADTKEAVEGEETEAAEVESKLAHNIDALLVVLAKVENPRAQQAIMKNIQKTFVKLEKKAVRLQEKDAKFAEKMAELEGKVSDEVTVGEEAAVKKEKYKKQKSEVPVVEEFVVEESTEANAEQTEKVNKGQEKKAEALENAGEKKNAGTAKVEEKKNNAGNNGKGNQSQGNKGQGNKGEGNGK
ncbi:DUF5667 domain-containing protein [Bacillus sp. MRMR6]|uniref:DUF5667 domain-containing protein n=1 Tax=Bacillus sp. MRMR6 TaxID=1928617 RepID=UPI0009534CA5|nr:DUF5667 domain-containing protein [Bacillus sp. MRMR6]OLS37839.1 hypothetical protein BTR25_15100 [Bacillus sp. MRMR6]